jgi:hypothetical protein
VNVLGLLSPLLSPAYQGDDGGIGIVGVLIQLVVVVYVIACLWMIYQKAGEEGWKAIIPIYNYMVLAKIVGRPMWWGLLPLIPCVGIVFAIILILDLGKSFGKSTVFSILGLILCGPIGLGILAFGSDRYLGPGGPPAGGFQGGYQGGPNYQ